MERSFLLFSVLLCLVTIGFSDHPHRSLKRSSATSTPKISPRQTTGEFTNEQWTNQAQATLKSKLGVNRSSDKQRPKNIIFFIGDGMNIQTTSAARLHVGGDESSSLSFDKFPYFGLSRTYCTNRQVPDSAATATAYLAGVKTNYGLIGVDSNVRRYNCEDHVNPNYHTESIAEWALAAGKAAGLVTTVRVTHASPAPLYAHSADRYWESDYDMKDDCDPDLYSDIAEQLVYGATGKKLKVVLGGGRSRFMNNTIVDEEGIRGLREDGKNLIQDWLSIHQEMGTSSYVKSREELLKIDYSKTDYLLGLFAEDYMKYDFERREDNVQPSLTDMTEAAIKMLQKEENGYFLFVEGGRIDNAHHANYGKAALDETKVFSEAIELAQRMTNSHDTLIVVSADHGHVMTYNGYANRSGDVFGVAGISDHDNLPYTVLSYANGMGNENMYGTVYGERVDVNSQGLGAFDFRYFGHFPLSSESHSGDDVGVYATGPQSYVFAGAYEQNALPYLMAYAAQIGPYAGDNSAIGVSLTGSLVVGVLAVNVIFKKVVGV